MRPLVSYVNVSVMAMRKPDFTRQLLKWHKKENTREMPWKGERELYKIWLSEIILQQTRVEQGIPYYEAFIRKYPDILALASAPEQEVFRLWQGLGYYSRCKNLIQTARQIRDHYQGSFPHTYEEILELPGVGPYTAAAICSFGFNLPYAVLDGNVFRVLSRFFGIPLPIDSHANKNYFSLLAQHLLDRKEPAVYNQAIMDFGALVCKPKQPVCTDCCLKKKCVALREKQVENWPVKSKKKQLINRYFHYLVLQSGGKVYLHKRIASDIWQNLFEFPLIESSTIQSFAQIRKNKTFQKILPFPFPWKLLEISPLYKQQLTHQKIHARFFYLELSCPLEEPQQDLPIPLKDLGKYPFPKLIISFLQEKTLTLKKGENGVIVN